MKGPAASLPRALFLNPAGVVGGAERGLLQVLDHFPPDQYLPEVVVPAPGRLLSELEARGIRAHVLPFPASLGRLSRGASAGQVLGAVPGGLGYLLRLARLLRARRAALLWSNGIKAHYLAGGLGPLLGIPYLLHLRDLAAPPGLNLLAKRARLVVANSPSTLANLPGAATGMVLPNALPMAAMRRAAPSRTQARARWRYAETDWVILAVGALTDHKGQARLLEAFARLAAQVPRARLLLVGGEPYVTQSNQGYRRRLVEQVEAAGLSSRVQLTGELSEPWEAYRAADLFALPSRSEGFGRVYLEAAAFGLPVLASRVGGASEIFSEGEALLLDPGNPAEWHEKLRQLADSPSMCRQYGHAAYARSRDFDLVHLPRRLARVVDRVRRPR